MSGWVRREDMSYMLQASIIVLTHLTVWIQILIFLAPKSWPPPLHVPVTMTIRLVMHLGKAKDPVSSSKSKYASITLTAGARLWKIYSPK